MTKRVLFIGFLILTSVFLPVARASQQELPFPEIKCRDELRAALDKWHVNGAWKAQPVITPGQPTYVASTETLGSWAQIQLKENGTVLAVLVSEGSQTGIHFDLQPKVEIRSQASVSTGASAPYDCVATEVKARKEIFSHNSGAQFSDKDLVSLMKKNKNGLILLWSPGMDYSLRAVTAAQEAAKRLKLPLEIILDSEADLASATKTQKAQRFPASATTRDHSLELYMRGAETHFPNFFVYSDGQLKRPMLPGLMTADGYVAYVEKGVR